MSILFYLNTKGPQYSHLCTNLKFYVTTVKKLTNSRKFCFTSKITICNFRHDSEKLDTHNQIHSQTPKYAQVLKVIERVKIYPHKSASATVKLTTESKQTIRFLKIELNS